MTDLSNQRAYPALPVGLETRLSAVETSASSHFDYFDSPECPYSEKLRGLLRRMCRRESADLAPARAFEHKSDDDKLDIILHEIEATVEQMTLLEGSLSGTDTGDRIQFVKAKTSLLEKWVSLKERIWSLKELAQFQSVVIKFLDDEMTKDQRLAFIEALRGLQSPKKQLETLGA